MDSSFLSLLLLASLFTHSLCMEVDLKHENKPTTSNKITVMGVVYCDICSNNVFSKQSYFLPGAKVHIECKLRATTPRATKEIIYSVNRTTDKYGVYKLEVPSTDGVRCAQDLAMESFCEASLIGSSSSSCSVPGLKTTIEGITVKSKNANICIYSLNALSYNPIKRYITLCGKHKEGIANSYNSSKFFYPFFPPFGFPFPFPFPPMPSFPLPQLPPLPSLPFPLPPFPSFPFPPLPFTRPPPSLPFPFPPLPPTSSLFSPSPPPPFDLRDPRTWVPFIPPSPPAQTHNQQP